MAFSNDTKTFFARQPVRPVNGTNAFFARSLTPRSTDSGTRYAVKIVLYIFIAVLSLMVCWMIICLVGGWILRRRLGNQLDTPGFLASYVEQHSWLQHPLTAPILAPCYMYLAQRSRGDDSSCKSGRRVAKGGRSSLGGVEQGGEGSKMEME